MCWFCQQTNKHTGAINKGTNECTKSDAFRIVRRPTAWAHGRAGCKHEIISLDLAKARPDARTGARLRPVLRDQYVMQAQAYIVYV